VPLDRPVHVQRLRAHELRQQDAPVRERPIYGGYYGGRGDPRLAGRFDEPGYIAQPACVWGSAEHGLEAPPLVSGVNLYAEAKTNSTYGHHGEMAWMQVYYLKEPRK